MTALGEVIKGRGRGVRCDGCGRISRDPNGHYFDKTLNKGGAISSKGRECEHDFCNECESKNGLACPKCGSLPPPQEEAMRTYWAQIEVNRKP